MPARHGNHVKAKSKKIQDEAKALGFHGVCTFGKICNKRDCALYHPSGWLKGPDEDEVVVAPSPAEAAEVIARRSRRVVSEGAVNPNFVLAEQKKLLREERIAQNAALASADLLREGEVHRRTRKASQRLSESVEEEPVIEIVAKKPEELEAVRRVQEKLALKREQQQREQEAERAAEEAKMREREQEKERLKQEKMERRERLKIERQEAKDKGPEEYAKWVASRRTLSCNSETGADGEFDLTQLQPTLSDPLQSDASNGDNNNIYAVEHANGHTTMNGDSEMIQQPQQQQQDQVMYHQDSSNNNNNNNNILIQPKPSQSHLQQQQPFPQQSEFITNYTNEPIQQYPWNPLSSSSIPQVRSRGPPGMPSPWTCVGCTHVNYNTLSPLCGQCGAPRHLTENARNFAQDVGTTMYGKPPNYAQGTYDWNNSSSSNGANGNLDAHNSSSDLSRSSSQSDLLPVDEMRRNHSTQVHPPHHAQQHNGLAIELPRYSTSESSDTMFRNFGQQRPLGNGVFGDFSRGQILHDSRHFAEIAWQKPTFRTIDELLESLNLSCLSSIFSAEDIDLAALKLLKQQHLMDMGIKLGPRVKLMKAIESL